jgi:hypothetical protein
MNMKVDQMGLMMAGEELRRDDLIVTGGGR